MAIEIAPVPAFKDNYLWVIHDGRYVAVVNPGDAAPGLNYLTQHSLELTTSLITQHRHRAGPRRFAGACLRR